MRKILAYLALVGLLFNFVGVGLGFAATIKDGEAQILTNGDFESGFSSGVAIGWTKYQTTDVTYSQTSNSHSGSSAQMMVSTAENVNHAGVRQTIAMTVGDKYVLTGWTKTNDTTNLAIEITGCLLLQSITVASDVWTSFSYTCTANNTSGQVFVHHNDLDTGNYIIYDDVNFTRYGGTVRDSDKQLLADGDMEAADISAWVAPGGSKVTSNVKSGARALRVTKVTDTTASARQAITTVGKTYRATGWVKSDGTAYGRFGGSGYYCSADANTNWTYLDCTFVADSTFFYLYTYSGLTGNYVEWDDVTVTLYNGKTQDSEKQLFADGDMESSGTGSWPAGGSATLSKSTTSPKTGSQVLRIVDSGVNSNIWAGQNNILVAGRTYRISGWARSDGVNLNPRIRDAASLIWIGTASTDWQRFDITFVSAGAIVYFYGADGNTGSYVEFDDVTITAY